MRDLIRRASTIAVFLAATLGPHPVFAAGGAYEPKAPDAKTRLSMALLPESGRARILWYFRMEPKLADFTTPAGATCRVSRVQLLDKVQWIMNRVGLGIAGGADLRILQSSPSLDVAQGQNLRALFFDEAPANAPDDLVDPVHTQRLRTDGALSIPKDEPIYIVLCRIGETYFIAYSLIR